MSKRWTGSDIKRLVLQKNKDECPGEGRNNHHPELHSAIQERHRIAASDLVRLQVSQNRTSNKVLVLNHIFVIWLESPERDETWKPWWWNDDSKWNVWSSRSQDDWRETYSSQFISHPKLLKGIGRQRWQSSSDRREVQTMHLPQRHTSSVNVFAVHAHTCTRFLFFQKMLSAWLKVSSGCPD